MNDVLDTARFGALTLDYRRRQLLAGGKPVALHARALELLAFLILNRARAVGHAEILAHVWEGRVVADNNLSVQLSALRKALAEAGCQDNVILTLPGRRYQFIGELLPPQAVPTGDAAAEAGPAEPPPALAPAPPAPPATAPALRQRPRLLPWLAGGAAGLGLAAAAGLWFAPLRPAAPVAPPLSIAVLPFRNESADRTRDYLAAAITDDLAADLGQIPASTVIAQESVAAVASEPMPRIGATLGVRYILSGSIVAEENTYHVVAKLSDAATGRSLWTRVFDPARGHLSDLRQEIVRGIASPLHVTLDQLASARSLADRPDNPDALDLFFRARAALHGSATLATFQAAEDLLHQALAKQPDFVDAQALLGWVLVRKATLTDDPDNVADLNESRAFTARALAVSPQNIQALATRAGLRVTVDDCAGARADANLILQLDPSSLSARRLLGVCDMNAMQLDEAAADYERILQLDPANPQNSVLNVTLGTIRLVQGRYAEAAALLAKGMSRETVPTSDLEPAEQAQLLFIAATYLNHDQATAKAAYRDYAEKFAGRSIWRISTHFPRLWRNSAALWRALDGLEAAGMPRYADEAEPGLPDGAPCPPGEFAPTPRLLPAGGQVLSTSDFARELARPVPPIVIDLGVSGEAASGWIAFKEETAAETATAFALRQARQHAGAGAAAPIIVLGTGVRGCAAYETARNLIENGFGHVMWYRGGEEAWHRHLAQGSGTGTVSP